MIEIGTREVVANFPQLHIPVGEKAVIDISIMGWSFKISIEFEDTAGEQQINAETTAENFIALKFRNWNNSLGSATSRPAQIATLSDGSIVEFTASNYRIAHLNVFSLQILTHKEAQ